MNIYSLKNNPELCKKAKLYCMRNWSKVYESFAKCADKSVEADTLPQTQIIKGMEDDSEILGFYQLIESEPLTVFTKLSPFISALYVDGRVRGGGFGELLINHAKYEAANLGFKKIYVASDHIGFYEKYGFSEIGLDIYEYGRAAKLYEADTPSDIRLELYNRRSPMPDFLLLEDAKLRWGELPKNPAKLLHHLKHINISADNPADNFVLTAFKDSILAGRVSFMQNPDNRLNWLISDLFVKTDFRRRGIAKALLAKGISIIKSKASGGELIYSDIEKNNEPSLRLFASLRFIDTEELKPFWKLTSDSSCTTHILKLY